MIALAIFGMIAAAGVALLAFSVPAPATTDGVLDDLGAMNRLASILTADLAQAQDRPTRRRAGSRCPPSPAPRTQFRCCGWCAAAGPIPMRRPVPRCRRWNTA
ncbi:PulJ/GspJ family protein [Sphingomonas sp. MMS24-JH45]